MPNCIACNCLKPMKQAWPFNLYLQDGYIAMGTVCMAVDGPNILRITTLW